MEVLGQQRIGYLFVTFFIYFLVVLIMKRLNVQVSFLS